MNKTAKWIVGVVVVALVIWALVAANKKSEQPAGNTGNDKIAAGESYKIGFIGPLTGDNGNLGQNAKAAVEIAVDEVNKLGGVNGKHIDVVYEDGKCNGKDASSAANKLMNIDKVNVILGGLCSGETLSFVKTANDSKVPVFSYCSSNPSITDSGDYIFRDYPSDSFQGVFGAKYVYQTLGKKKVAVLYGKNDWATGIKGVFVKSFTDLGGQVAYAAGYDPASRDFRTELSKIKATGPELVYFVGYTGESAVALKQAKELKITIPFFGADAWDDAKIPQQAGAAANGAMYTVAATKQSDLFKTSMKEKTGSDEVIVCSPFAYDAVKILAQVMAKAGGGGEAIKNELYKVSYTGGVSNDPISFDSNGDLSTANYVIKTYQDGKIMEVK